MRHILHHTCSKKGGQEYVLKNFPFKSKHDPKKGYYPFLGTGFYFWDYNLDYAKVWGQSHYRNSFFVCESEVEIDHELDGFYLDLVGNRQHLKGFVELLEELNLVHTKGCQEIDLCYIIEYLRDIKKNCPDIFPYKVIRALDYSHNNYSGVKILFNGIRKSYTLLDPRIIISFIDKKNIVKVSESIIKFAS